MIIVGKFYYHKIDILNSNIIVLNMLLSVKNLNIKDILIIKNIQVSRLTQNNVKKQFPMLLLPPNTLQRMLVHDLEIHFAFLSQVVPNQFHQSNPCSRSLQYPWESQPNLIVVPKIQYDIPLLYSIVQQRSKFHHIAVYINKIKLL